MIPSQAIGPDTKTPSELRGDAPMFLVARFRADFPSRGPTFPEPWFEADELAVLMHPCVHACVHHEYLIWQHKPVTGPIDYLLINARYTDDLAIQQERFVPGPTFDASPFIRHDAVEIMTDVDPKSLPVYAEIVKTLTRALDACSEQAKHAIIVSQFAFNTNADIADIIK